jgi:hypothetical protein
MNPNPALLLNHFTVPVSLSATTAGTGAGAVLTCISVCTPTDEFPVRASINDFVSPELVSTVCWNILKQE